MLRAEKWLPAASTVLGPLALNPQASMVQTPTATETLNLQCCPVAEITAMFHKYDGKRENLLAVNTIWR